MHTHELPLNDVNSIVVVIDKDGVDLFVIGAIRNLGLRFVHIPHMDVAGIPCNETLPLIRKILDVVILLDLFLDFLVHHTPSINHTYFLLRFLAPAVG